jgi:hypothetical protein
VPNLTAYLALIFWPLVAVLLYRFKPPAQATLWTILAAQLLLPVGTFFKFEMIPQFDKNSIPSLCALIGCMVVARRRLHLWNGFGFLEMLLCTYLASPIVTSLLNGDPVGIGRTVLPGVGIYDGLSAMLSQLVTLVPFFLGRQFLRNADDLYEIFRVLVVAGLAYSVLLLFEIRFSPQLHFWLYGYYPSDFIMEMREGGAFRPMAFMGHGIITCFFEMTTLVACAALWRTNDRVFGRKCVGFTLYLGLLLYLCKSAAALVYGLVLTPLVRWTQPKFQMRVALLLVTLALLYPMLRISEVFPANTLVDVASGIDPARAGSLQFRFDQEEILLAHASERRWFGWGRYGRNRVFVENWEGIGADTSVTDGRWIIAFGQFGLFGFLAEFGILALPVFRAAKALRFASSFRESLFLAASSLMIAVNIIDLLPNSFLTPWTWLLAGSLLGRSEAILGRVRPRFRSDGLALQYR